MDQYSVNEFIISYYKLECHVCKCHCKCLGIISNNLLEHQSRWSNQWFTLPTIVLEYDTIQPQPFLQHPSSSEVAEQL